LGSDMSIELFRSSKRPEPISRRVAGLAASVLIDIRHLLCE
jgi:hypothetical protein